MNPSVEPKEKRKARTFNRSENDWETLPSVVMDQAFLFLLLKVGWELKASLMQGLDLALPLHESWSSKKYPATQQMFYGILIPRAWEMIQKTQQPAEIRHEH